MLEPPKAWGLFRSATESVVFWHLSRQGSRTDGFPRLAQPGRRLFRGDLGDQDPPDAVGALGLTDQLEVPVVVVANGGPLALENAGAEVGGGVQGQLVAGVTKPMSEYPEVPGDQAGQVGGRLRGERLLERAPVAA